MSNSVSSLIHSDIQAACSTLGGWDEGKYFKEPECIESLKDLLRYLRRDDESHEIRRILGRIQVLKTDLLPLLKFFADDSTLFDIVLRLLVDLTNPAILLYKEEVPIEKFARNNYLEIISHLQSYKLAFTDSKVWIAITKKLETLLHRNWETRQEEDKDTIERILVLIRNIVHVPANPSEEKRTDDDVSIHDQVLWAMHLAHLEDLLLYISSSEDETDYCFHSLEILSLMLREQSPQVLASAAQARSTSEKEQDVKALLRARELELSRKKAQIQSKSSRHPRFGGTFTVKNMKSISDNALIVRDRVRLSQVDFDRDKNFRAKPKNKRPPVEESTSTRRSTLNIRLFLKGLCVDFLKWSYNPMMRTVKSFLRRERAQSHDESYYFWAMRFFMEFNRCNGFEVGLVSETIAKESFHYVQTQLEQYYEMMVTDKRLIHVWAKRLHIALKAYHELLRTLAAMDGCPDEKVKEAARALKGTLFYLPEYREIVLHLLLNFNDSVQTNSYLRDLVAMVHVYVKMLEQFAKKHSHVVVKSKKKPCRKSKPKARPPARGAAGQGGQEDQEKLWLEVACGLSLALRGEEELPEDVVPYDSTLDNTEEEKKLDALSRIQTALKANLPARAVALLRASREVWPDQDMFGAEDSGNVPEGGPEFRALREIFCADIQHTAPPATTAEDVTAPPDDGPFAENASEERGQEDREDDEEEEEEERAPVEQEFNFHDFISRFAKPKVIMVYCKLLSHYRTNPAESNRHVVRMLHRLSWDLKMSPLLYQASVFKSFQAILRDYRSLPGTSISEDLRELARLATFVVRDFVETTRDNKLAFVELLFWKNTKDAYEIKHGYGSSAQSAHSGKVTWTEEQEYELKTLYDRYKDEVTPDKDAVDLILEHMMDDSKTRRMVVRQLKNLGLVANTAKFRKGARAHCPWRAEEIEELRDLFTQYREATDTLRLIMDRMSHKRPKHRVVDKLIELQLVPNRKALYKKTSGRKGTATSSRKGTGGPRLMGLDSELDTTDSSSDDDARRGAPSNETPGQEGATSSGTSRKGPGGQRLVGLDSELDTTDSSSDDNAGRGDSRGVAARPAQNGRAGRPGLSRSSRRVPVADVAATSEHVKTALAKLVDGGFQESLEWLLSSLEDAVEDWDSEDATSTPLVPLAEAHHSSMEDGEFCSLLRSIGVTPPVDEQNILNKPLCRADAAVKRLSGRCLGAQEVYWRIPAHMTDAMLQSRIELIRKALQGDFAASLLVPSPPEPAEQTSTKRNTKRMEAMRELLARKALNQNHDGSSKSARCRKQPSPKSFGDEESSGTSSDEDAVMVLSSPPSLSEASATAIREGNVKRKRTALPEDSDSELDSSSHVISRKKAKDNAASTSPRSPSVSKTSKGRRIVLRDSDDDDMESLPDPFAATEAFHDPAPGQDVGARRPPKRLVVLDDSDDDDRDNDMGDGTERADDHAVTVIDDGSVAESGANPDVVSSATGVVPLDDSDDDEVIVAGRDPGAAGESRAASSLKRAVIVSSDDED